MQRGSKIAIRLFFQILEQRWLRAVLEQRFVVLEQGRNFGATIYIYRGSARQIAPKFSTGYPQTPKGEGTVTLAEPYASFTFTESEHSLTFAIPY